MKMAAWPVPDESLLRIFVPSRSNCPPLDVDEIFPMLWSAAQRHTAEWRTIEQHYQRDLQLLWLRTHGRAAGGGAVEPVIAPAPGDRRFKAADWAEQTWFDYMKQSYLLLSRYLLELADFVDLTGKAKGKLLFRVQQYLDAIAPTNFPTTNPEVLKLTVETGGRNLALGLCNLFADVERGRITLSDESAFEVGRNLAVTPGAVIFENTLIQLIQYAPLGEFVHERPLLIVPPCISKYYMLDLRPENSLVRYCVEQGHTVFLISWRNVPVDLGDLTWDDYVSLGAMTALDIVHEITGVDRVNTLGFCVGGVILACALAVLRANGRRPAASLTLLATMLDYEASGDLGLLVDEAYVRSREAALARGGIVPATDVAAAFASLRANEFIWSYVINNYLKGKTPPPFDLLYWNGDQANLPGAMFRYYIRNMYLENNLAQPGRLTMCGTPVDLGRIDVPTYIFGAKEDHISPWKCTYVSTQLLGDDVRFVLGASGHVAGVINPAAKKRRNYWISGTAAAGRPGRPHADPEGWLATAKLRPGSWWAHWSAWLARHAGPKIPARAALGSAEHRAIEPAPGRYVKERV